MSAPAAPADATVTLADIRAAASRLAGQVLDTPCVESRTLGQILGTQVFLKFENLQFTASFKERGALNKLAAMIESGAPITGVIAASAGNHAQGVAHHAQRLGLRAVIVMPVLTPTVKVERTRGFGAEVVLHGESFDAARERALEIAADQGLQFIHPFDDPLVIAGQGTIALEMLRAQPELDTLVIAVGGGGGTSIACTGMRQLPYGIPKLMVSTLASGDTSPYVGTSDIIMVPSVTDIAGLNRLSRVILSNAAHALIGAAEEILACFRQQQKIFPCSMK